MQSLEDLSSASAEQTMPQSDLITKVRELGLDLFIHAGVLLRFRQLPPCCLLPLVVCSALDLSPLLQTANR